MVVCVYYIHPELRIRNYRFRSGKGAGPLGSRAALEGAAREQGGAVGEGALGQSRGAAHWSLNWLPCTRP